MTRRPVVIPNAALSGGRHMTRGNIIGRVTPLSLVLVMAFCITLSFCVVRQDAR